MKLKISSRVVRRGCVVLQPRGKISKFISCPRCHVPARVGAMMLPPRCHVPVRRHCLKLSGPWCFPPPQKTVPYLALLDTYKFAITWNVARGITGGRHHRCKCASRGLRHRAAPPGSSGHPGEAMAAGRQQGARAGHKAVAAALVVAVFGKGKLGSEWAGKGWGNRAHGSGEARTHACVPVGSHPRDANARARGAMKAGPEARSLGGCMPGVRGSGTWAVACRV
jgi:hypothetical protein